MEAVKDISISKMVQSRMQDVRAGRLTYSQAIERIHKARLTREDIIEQLTEQYDQQTVDAFHFFRLL